MVRAPLMFPENEVRYPRVKKFQAVDLAYRGDDLSRLLLLPGRMDSLDDLEKTISTPMLCLLKRCYHRRKRQNITELGSSRTQPKSSAGAAQIKV